MDTFDAALSALGKRDFAAAENLLLTCVAANTRVTEAYFYLAVGAILQRHEAAANAYLSTYMQLPPPADDFYAKFGSLLDSLKADGEALRHFLKKKRLLPYLPSARMSTEKLAERVEPWFYDKELLHFFPRSVGEFSDHASLVERYVLPGHVPSAPPFNRHSSVMTVGSCFADELKNYLMERGYNTGLIHVPSGLNNTFALRQFIEWCATGKQSDRAYWYGEGEDGGAANWQPVEEQQAYYRTISSASGFVFTLGLAEVWEDTHTGAVFWRGIPKRIYDPARHKSRMSTVDENAANLHQLVKLIHGVNPAAQIVLTLSPVPLKATFEDRSCVAADCVSKSTLRVAIDQTMRAGLPRVSYWPSFEIVRWLGSHMTTAMFGEDGSVRHVNRHAVKLIVDAFMRHYYAD